MFLTATRTDGFSIIGVMVAVGIFAVVSVGLGKMASSQMRAGSRIEANEERISIKRAIEGRLSCSETNTLGGVGPGCTDGSIIEVFDINSNSLISKLNASATKMGKFTVRALCSNAPGRYGIEIQVARPKPGVNNPLTTNSNANFLPDPLNQNQILKWQTTAPAGYISRSSLFPQGALPCSTLISGVPAGNREWRGSYMVWSRTDEFGASQGSSCITSNTFQPSLGCNCPAGANSNIVGQFASQACQFYHTAAGFTVNGPDNNGDDNGDGIFNEWDTCQSASFECTM